jgi:hypothetical protein
MGAGRQADSQGVGKYRDIGARHYLVGQERQGKPIAKVDAVVAVLSRHREARAVSVH